MFSNAEEKKKTNLKKFLEHKIEAAGKEFDSAKKSKFTQIFGRTKSKDLLSLDQIIIKGVDYALRSAIVKGAPAATVIYDTVANLMIDRTQRHVQQAMNTVQPTDQSAAAVLSFNIIQNGKIAESFKHNAARMRHEIQAAIFATSEYIQAEGFSSLDEVLDAPASPPKKQQILNFVNGHYRLYVSYQSMSIALQLFSVINQELLERIGENKNRSPNEAHKLAIINAILVYEVADVIIAFLHAFELQGVKEILEIHAQVSREIARGRKENEEILVYITDYIATLENTSTDTCLDLSQKTAAAEERLGALNELEKEWSELINKINKIQKNAYTFKNCIADLELIKREAAANLTILGLINITKMVKDNIKTIQGVLQINKLQVESITADDVRRFLKF